MHTAMAGPSHAAMVSADEEQSISLCIGEHFKSFQQLEEKIQQYEQQNFVKFWKCDCRTIRATQKSVNRPLYKQTYQALRSHLLLHSWWKAVQSQKGRETFIIVSFNYNQILSAKLTDHVAMLLVFHRTFCKDCPAELCLRASEDELHWW